MKSPRVHQMLAIAVVAGFPAVLWAQAETQVANAKATPVVETRSDFCLLTSAFMTLPPSVISASARRVAVPSSPRF